MKANNRSRWIKSVSAICVTLIVVFTLLEYLEYSPSTQDTLWELASAGVLGSSPKSLTGVPQKCGNAAPLQTMPWMNPKDFNKSVEKPNSRSQKFLQAPALDSPIFVVGCGHSGTTELINILNRHPLIHAYLDGPGMEFAVQPNSFAPAWSLLPVWSRRDDVWLQKLAHDNHAWHWAVKSPSNICRLGYILKSLPHARVIMIVRDGRDSLLSLMERFPKKDMMGDFVLGRWVNDNTAGLLYHNDPRVLIVRLEDLSNYPHEWLPIILHHIATPATWSEFDALIRRFPKLERRPGKRRLLDEHSGEIIPDTTPSHPTKEFFQNIHVQQSLTSLKFYDDPPELTQLFENWVRDFNRSQSLVDSLLSPNPTNKNRRLSSQQDQVPMSSDVLSGVDFGEPEATPQELPGGEPSLRKRHDDLRKYQVSQPLRPIKPKWPEMPLAIKTAFKSNSRAVRLLKYFGYAEDSEW